MQSAQEGLKSVQYFRAPNDNRIIAIYIAPDFREYDYFPPQMETVEEINHVNSAYELSDPMREIETKAHVTDNAWPLQIILLGRDLGATTKPHYHVPNEPLPTLPTRHQVLICLAGAAKVGVFTTAGDEVGYIDLTPKSMILMLEGHSVEFLEPGTRLVEIKQGPFPGTDADDKVELQVLAK